MLTRRFPLGLALLIFLPLAAAGEVSPDAKKTECVTDRIEAVPAKGGYAVLIGWAADPVEGRVSKMEIVSEGGLLSEVTRWGEWRPDVMAHFKRPDYLWSGWTATISLAGASPRAYSVEVFAVSRKGVRTSCGRQQLVVRDAPAPPRRSPWSIGLEILWRTAALIAWLALVGWAASRFFCLRPIPLSAPIVGLALFAVGSEAGAAIHVRPFHSAVAVTILAIVALLVLLKSGTRRLLPSRAAAGALGAAAIFVFVSIVPLASHGEGAVLGDIDDGVRQCAVADSIAQFGWHIPTGMRGYLVGIREGWDSKHIRRGDVYLLSALASASRERAHAVHSVAMLGSGCLVVLGTGLLAFRVLRSARRTRWIPPVLVALNSTLIATLYGQHLGNLLGAALFLLFLYSAFVLVRSRRSDAFVPVALCLAAGSSLYPEVLPAWGVAAGLSLLSVRGFRRQRRGAARLLLALVVAAAMNPIAVREVVRSWAVFAAEPMMASGYSRMVVGDTHYFPSLNVVTGLTAYRIDAPAPVGAVRSLLVPVAAFLIIVVSVLGWRYLSTRRRWLVMALLAPVALALWTNYRLEFPYGFAKFLTLAVPVWAVSFGLFASRVLGRAPRGSPARVLAAGTIALVLLLEIPAARHVVRLASRAVMSYDPAFRSLPALARVAGRRAVFRFDDYPIAGEHWVFYFLGENAVDFDSKTDRFPGEPYFRIVDRRRTLEPPAGAIASTRDFWLVPIAAQR